MILFAPNPTGYMHIGSLCTYMAAYDYARANYDQLAVRFDYLATLAEDVQEYYEYNMLNLLESLDLAPDVVFHNKQSDAFILNSTPDDCVVYDVCRYMIGNAPYYVPISHNLTFRRDYHKLITTDPVETQVIIPVNCDGNRISKIKGISDSIYRLRVDKDFVQKMYEVPYPIHKWPYSLNIGLFGTKCDEGWRLSYVPNAIVTSHLHGVTHVFRGASSSYIRLFMEIEQSRILRLPLSSQTIVPTIQNNGRKIRKTGNHTYDETVVEHLLQLHPDLISKIRRFIQSQPRGAFVDYAEILR